MAALHSAMQALAPVTFADVPTSADELNAYISDLFTKAETVIESVPMPDEPAGRTRSATVSSIASNSSEMSSSSARSAPPPTEFQALQKEWGKPLKINAKDNPQDIAVYKLSGKDGRGAWFARRSVHEGLGFARFRKALEREFPETLKVQGAPGEGNIRGIGGERRVESIPVDSKGVVDVYHLSAQFPGPTAPRDFVTFLVTSSKALKQEHTSKVPEIAPRHYMVISKPCYHPQCPPRDGFVRGQYESVEFIREVPGRLKKARSTNGLRATKSSGGDSPGLTKDVLPRNLPNQSTSFPLHHDNKSVDNLEKGVSLDPSPPGRKRSTTLGNALNRPNDGTHDSDHDDYDADANPVEWIMVTRSDPGGGIPRFMVERGTPSSIVADAYKFLSWACQAEPAVGPPARHGSIRLDRRDSFESWQANGHLAGISEQNTRGKSSGSSALAPPTEHDTQRPATSGGIIANVSHSLTSTLENYAPQVVVDHLPPHPTLPKSSSIEAFPAAPTDNNDASSTISSTSFASADSHLNSSDDDENQLSISSSLTSPSKEKDKPKKSSPKPSPSPHDVELAKLQKRRETLQKKLHDQKEKILKDKHSQSEKEALALRKAEEKHEKELKKQEEKYRREVAKLEQKKEKERQKIEERKRKAEERDEKAKLVRERDEAREEVEVLKKEREVWMRQVQELQRENTALAARLGKSGEFVAGGERSAKGLVVEGGVGLEVTRSRSSTVTTGGGAKGSSLKGKKSTEEVGAGGGGGA